MKSSPTPMMAQFLEIKAQYPDALLFYRMGDFYEMFFDDATSAAAALDIALTKRGKHEGADIPMCGVPVHSAESYLLSLIRKGFRVAVCEQMEDPAEAKKRGSKAVVRREVVRLVTPGTLTEESLLEARSHNYLAAWSEMRNKAALAWVDISTGAVRVLETTRLRLSPELARLRPREVLLPENLEEPLYGLVEEAGCAPTVLGKASFESANGEKRLCATYGVSDLSGFGQFSRVQISALGALLDYLDLTQKGQLPLLHPPTIEQVADVMQIDAATRRNLELTHAMAGGRAGSLLSVIDTTLTAGGARLLETRLSGPSRHLPTILSRQESVSYFVESPNLGETTRDMLRKTPDLERALSRIALERAGPRDLASVRGALTQAEALAGRMGQQQMLPPLLGVALEDLQGQEALLTLLDTALVADPPLLARDGGYIAPGYHGELDEMRSLRDEGRGVIARMQQGFAEETGIPSLKVKHNNVLGYFIETTATHADKMLSPPLSERFIHRQTTANAVRFTTLELSELETKIHNAAGRALEIEKRLFTELAKAVQTEAPRLSALAQAVAEFDVATALANLANAKDWSRPHLEESRCFEIVGGRHPVVEQALARQNGGAFVPNDCALSDGSRSADIWLLTGPNMSGKSTFLRQNALIALLAQMGSYVPAKSAQIGVVSQLFSRVGASDDLARGRSTFMVEMVETAAILNQADERALVILDEIGRGTATYDGLSIAWATLEYLHEVNRSRALFATHYHEMTALSDRLAGVSNATVAVREWEGDVVFLHEVRKGAADRSYGVQVARLAGLPAQVVQRAREVLEKLEQASPHSGAGVLIDDLPLFSAATPPAPKMTAQDASPLHNMLAQISPDELSPREALDLLYQLKEKAEESKGTNTI